MESRNGWGATLLTAIGACTIAVLFGSGCGAGALVAIRLAGSAAAVSGEPQRLSGTQGQDFDEQRVSLIRSGVHTPADVVNIMGNPRPKVFSNIGEEMVLPVLCPPNHVTVWAGKNPHCAFSGGQGGPSRGNDNTSLSVVPSRLSIEFRNNPSFGGPVRIYFENDFAGNPDHTPAFRLRHFFGQWTNVLVGQTWTAFQDPDAIPDTVDFKGPNSLTIRLQPLIRYTHAINDENNVALSVEQPGTEGVTTITTPTGRINVTPTAAA